ncbi:MAG: maltotransferase domain-containing protein [Rhodothermales bacterium]
MVDNTLPSKWSRVVLAWIKPVVDGGRWPVKRSVGETVTVTAAWIADGHNKIAGELFFRDEDDEEDRVRRMELLHNDEYQASFDVDRLGRYTYRVRAWIDRFATWQDQYKRRIEGGDTEYEIKSELLDGAALLREAAEAAEEPDAGELLRYAEAFEDGDVEAALNQTVLKLAQSNDPRKGAVVSETYELQADPELARFAAWYEFFPRSAPTKNENGHATLNDAAKLLPRIKEMGFDVVYLPPVHPIGRTHRKGKDNAPTAAPDEPGSPWAIGAGEGGHKTVHPDLGGLEAFDRFVSEADELGLAVALDIAFQTSPDHPYVKKHPDWFKQRPDGSIRYAENPPKKYQDVYPINFESADWKNLWVELKSVFEFWIERGVKVFRVDNPHTKPFAFWEWCLGELRRDHPETVYLAEAFSRPKIMYQLAKLGYNNSYTYFTWRNTKEELVSYCLELYDTEVGDFFRPNFWPNTPDILHDYLVHGGRPAHVIRFVLAATLSSAYGLYGPPYEHVDNRRHPDREEYANNEKYEVRSWNWHDPSSLQPLIKRVNAIRRENSALHHMRNVTFHETDSAHLLAYSKRHEDNLILVIVNLDPYHEHQGWVHLPLDELDIPEERPYEMHDMLGGERYYWSGADNFVKLSPHVTPVHIFRVYNHPRRESDFDYFV